MGSVVKENSLSGGDLPPIVQPSNDRRVAITIHAAITDGMLIIPATRIAIPESMNVGNVASVGSIANPVSAMNTANPTKTAAAACTRSIGTSNVNTVITPKSVIPRRIDYLGDIYSLSPATTGVSNGSSPTMRTILMDRLQVNVISIVIGALIISIFIAWVDASRAWCAGILDKCDNVERYRTAKRKTVSAIVVTLISLFIIVLIATYFQYEYK